MEPELERLRQRIAVIRYQLETLAMQQLKASSEVNSVRSNTPEEELRKLFEVPLRVEEKRLKAELLYAHFKMAELLVEAEVERVRNLAVCPSIKQLVELRARCEQVLEDHQQIAEQMTEQALDHDRACRRLNGEEPEPQVELTEQQKREKQQEQEYDLGISR